MRLSICIPTYNRADYLPELLDSILAQRGYACELEVVISDNASTDATPVVAERYRSRFDRFVFDRAETNQGADRNFLKVVTLASGDYCWLMGSDDKLEPGGIAAVEAALVEAPGAAGVLVRNTSYDMTMQHRIPIEGSSTAFEETTVLDGDAATIFSAIGAHFGYISANVVDRALWQQAVATSPVERYFNAWVHVYVIGRILQLRPRWIYLAQACVGWRCGNDSFLSEGMYKRLRIDLAGYDEVVCGLFGAQSAIRDETLRRILPHARQRILHSKANGASLSFYAKSFGLLFRYYKGSPRFWLTCAPVFFLPTPATKLAKRVRRGRKQLIAPSPGNA